MNVLIIICGAPDASASEYWVALNIVQMVTLVECLPEVARIEVAFCLLGELK